MNPRHPAEARSSTAQTSLRQECSPGSRPITFTLPAIETTADLTKATRALMQGVADGEITPSEAAELSKLVDAHVKAIEATDFEKRLRMIEEARLA